MTRIRHIDGLRAIAVMLVVVHHATSHSWIVAHGYSGLARLTAEGAHGVDLFFVLSGFCLSYPVLKDLASTGAAHFNVSGYFARRVIRIVPPYYAAIALFAFIPGLAVSWPDVMKQALFLDWNTHLLNGSFWTLCVEFRWYFLFPLALLLWIRSPRTFIALVAAIYVAYTCTRLRAIDFGVLPAFLLGIVAADLFLRPRPWVRYAWVAVPAFAAIGVLLEPHMTVGTAYGSEVAIFFEQTNPGWQLAMFAGVVVIGSDTKLMRAFAVAPLVWVGVASYSIYLVHEPLVAALDKGLHAPLLVIILLALLSAVAAGGAFWFVFERPWLGGRLKQAAVAFVDGILARGFGMLELPRRIAVEPAVAPVTFTAPVSDI